MLTLADIAAVYGLMAFIVIAIGVAQLMRPSVPRAAPWPTAEQAAALRRRMAR